MDADSLACAYGMLGLVDPEQNKGDSKRLLKYILRQFNSEDAKGSADENSSWYKNLHGHLEWIHLKGKCKTIGKK